MTKAQEQILAVLRSEGFVGRTFRAQDAFPGTTPQDNANRRVLDSLVREGILAHGVAPQGRALSPIATEAIAEMQARRERIEQANVRMDMATGREARQRLESWWQGQGIDPKASYDVPRAREIADEALEAKMISPEVHQRYEREVLWALQDEPVGVQMVHLGRLQEEGPQQGEEGRARRPNMEKGLYHFAPQREKAVQRERETSLGHKAEQHRGQEMGL